MIFCVGKKLGFILVGFTLSFLLAPAGKVQAQSDWSKEWEKTLAAAKKEGQVTFYIYRYDRVVESFQKDYPDIRITSVTGRGAQLTNRIMAERRAEKYLEDVYS